MLHEGSLTALRQEANTLETELVKEGVLKPKSKTPKKDSQPDEGEPEQDQHEAILQSAQNCELRLAEVVAKAKERLADSHSELEEQARPHANGDFSEEALAIFQPEQAPNP